GAFIQNKDRVDDQTWKFLLKEDLDKSHPILYRGTNNNGDGHAFVCDGYQDTSYFHFNWGWGGYSDGFYYLDPINPQMSFKWGQGAVFNITPNDAAYCSNIEYNQPAWTFDDGSGPNYYFNNTNCSWQISLDTLNFSAIKIYFTKFDLLEGDYLRLYEGTDETGTLIGNYTRGTNPPAQIISNSNKIFIKFETNGTGQANGWEISYETVLTGINSFNARHIEIYPNPFTDLLYLKGIESRAKISISDISGKTLISLDNYNGNEIDLSNLKSGIYILNIRAENLNKSFKIMKN
ncbi:MAG: C10 family peptidase, partial [Bacteroidales bacterium]